MKYIKTYNKLFESHTDDIIENVKDILLPINDMGYNVSVEEITQVNHYVLNGKTNQLIIRVVTYVDKPLLITDEVKEEFIRMKDYLHSEGYDSIEANYYTRFNAVPDSPSNKEVKELDEFINVKDPIVNLLFVVKKKL
jgi:hypothetical protein